MVPDVNRPVLVGLALELQEVPGPDIIVIIIINLLVITFMRVIIMMIYLARVSIAAWSVPSSCHSEISPTLYLEHIKSLSS